MSVRFLADFTVKRAPQEQNPNREPGWNVYDRDKIVAMCDEESEARAVHTGVVLAAEMAMVASTSTNEFMRSGWNDRIQGYPYGRVFVANDGQIRQNSGEPAVSKWTLEQKRVYIAGYDAAARTVASLKIG